MPDQEGPQLDKRQPYGVVTIIVGSQDSGVPFIDVTGRLTEGVALKPLQLPECMMLVNRMQEQFWLAQVQRMLEEAKQQQIVVAPPGFKMPEIKA
jgi:hypothetical protein